MPSPSVTYTFANSTTADAAQVNQNFTDLINGMTDGTKDFSLNALTVAGAATLNGNVTLGNASADDLTITASLASSIPVKTNATYNIGASTLGLASVYFGNSTFSTRLVPNTLTANGTSTLPAVGGTLSNLIDFSNAGDLGNCSIAASVGASALTVALKSNAGTDPSASDPVYIAFRSATATTGTVVRRSVTGALSVVVSSGSTLGHTSTVADYIYVYALDNAGTVELAVSSYPFDDNSVQTTVAEGGAGAADSRGSLYSTTQRTGVAVRLIARLKSTQATAGTWATAISEISPGPFFRSTTTQWAPYTPSIGTGAGTVSANTAVFKQVGDTVYVKGGFTCGTVAASLITVSLPLSYAIDSTKCYLVSASNARSMKVGLASGQATSVQLPILISASTSTSLVYFGNLVTTATSLTPTNGSTSLSNSTVIDYEFEFPISTL